jgi:hypothetical protein
VRFAENRAASDYVGTMAGYWTNTRVIRKAAVPVISGLAYAGAALCNGNAIANEWAGSEQSPFPLIDQISSIATSTSTTVADVTQPGVVGIPNPWQFSSTIFAERNTPAETMERQVHKLVQGMLERGIPPYEDDA